MALITEQQRQQLLANGKANAERIAIDGNTIDFKPVVKLFTPWGGCTWLLSELDPESPDTAVAPENPATVTLAPAAGGAASRSAGRSQALGPEFEIAADAGAFGGALFLLISATFCV